MDWNKQGLTHKYFQTKMYTHKQIMLGQLQFGLYTWVSICNYIKWVNKVWM